MERSQVWGSQTYMCVEQRKKIKDKFLSLIYAHCETICECEILGPLRKFYIRNFRREVSLVIQDHRTDSGAAKT